MVALNIKRFTTIMFCWLALNAALAHAMDQMPQTNTQPPYLNVHNFLTTMKKKYSNPVLKNYLIILESVLLQYHPNEQNNIIGRNLKRLHRMSQNAGEHFSLGHFYGQMLDDLSQATGPHPLTQSDEYSSSDDDNHTTKCSICLGQLQGPITLETCPHNFCYSCLFHWYLWHQENFDMHTCCTLCRNPLSDKIKSLFENDPAYKNARKKICRNIKQEHRENLVENAQAAWQIQNQIQDAAANQPWGHDIEYDQLDPLYN